MGCKVQMFFQVDNIWIWGVFPNATFVPQWWAYNDVACCLCLRKLHSVLTVRINFLNNSAYSTACDPCGPSCFGILSQHQIPSVPVIQHHECPSINGLSVRHQRVFLIRLGEWTRFQFFGTAAFEAPSLAYASEDAWGLSWAFSMVVPYGSDRLKKPIWRGTCRERHSMWRNLDCRKEHSPSLSVVLCSWWFVHFPNATT